MDETKMKSIVDEYLCKSNSNMQNLLHKKLNKLEENLKKDINEIRKTVNDVERSQTFITAEYDKQKRKIQDLINDNKNIHLENQRLKQEIDTMNNKQEENEINLNKLAQYHRSSFMLEISGIPRRKQEDAIKLVEKVVQKAKIKDFHREQIDLAHRTSASSTAPIIILFNKKLDRHNFFKQKKQLFSVNAEQIVEKNDKEDSEGTKDEEDADDEVSMPGIEENSRRKKNL